MLPHGAQDAHAGAPAEECNVCMLKCQGCRVGSPTCIVPRRHTLLRLPAQCGWEGQAHTRHLPWLVEKSTAASATRVSSTFTALCFFTRSQASLPLCD